MRKTFSILILITILIFWVIPVFADEGPVQCCKLRHKITIDGATQNNGAIIGSSDTVVCAFGTPIAVSNWAAFCSLDAIHTIADLINVVAFVFSGIVLAVAGILYFTSAGSPTRLATAQKFFFSGLIGALIVVLSRFIISFGRFILGI